jgi:hypothetical protein
LCGVLVFLSAWYSIRSEISGPDLSRYNVWRGIPVWHLLVAKPLTTIIWGPKHSRSTAAVQSCFYKHEIRTIFPRDDMRNYGKYWQTTTIEKPVLFFTTLSTLISLAPRTYPSIFQPTIHFLKNLYSFTVVFSPRAYNITAHFKSHARGSMSI